MSSESLATNIAHPNEHDVVFGRGRPYQRHPGNVRLHAYVDSCREQYMKAQRAERLVILKNIVRAVQNHELPGRFLKRSDTEDGSVLWEEVSLNEAAKKVGHTMRSRTRGFASNLDGVTVPGVHDTAPARSSTEVSTEAVQPSLRSQNPAQAEVATNISSALAFGNRSDDAINYTSIGLDGSGLNSTSNEILMNERVLAAQAAAHQLQTQQMIEALALSRLQLQQEQEALLLGNFGLGGITHLSLSPSLVGTAQITQASHLAQLGVMGIGSVYPAENLSLRVPQLLQEREILARRIASSILPNPAISLCENAADVALSANASQDLIQSGSDSRARADLPLSGL